MPTLYRVDFERVGRTHDVIPAYLSASSADNLAEQIHTYASQHLASRNTMVYVDLDQMTGHISAGGRSAGAYTITDATALPRAELTWTRDQNIDPDGWTASYADRKWHLVKRTNRDARLGGWYLTLDPELSGAWIGTRLANAKAVAPLVVADLFKDVGIPR